MSFTHLHLHSEYSLLDGLPKIKDLVSQAKKLKMDSLAVTDHGTMHAAIEFYQECLNEGIKPIIGMEAYISKADHRERKKAAGKYRLSNHLTLLAKDITGYQNLMKLTSIAHLEGFYYKPRVDKETLAKHSQGLICLSGCTLGELAEYLNGDEFEKAKETATWFANTFGSNNYYLEIQRHNYSDFIEGTKEASIRQELQEQQKKEDKINLAISKLSKNLGLPLVATNDVHYLKPDQAVAQDALVCIQTGKQVADTNRMRTVDTPTFYLKSSQEMKELFSDLPEAVKNSQKIAGSCNLKLTLGKWFFPNYEIPEGKEAGDYLKETTLQGAKKIYGSLNQEVKERINYELGIIEDKGYSQYFLIVADMVNWCTAQDIITTTRGSAAGSIVSYSIGITSIDPLVYNLPFERFLNPFRPSPPDIDLDIADNKRENLISYITQKYGADKVAQICTFGRMLARASVRDVGRVLGFPYSVPDKIAKAIPLGSQGFQMTIKKALGASSELKQMYDTSSDAKKILDLAQQIEGNSRHTSVHAAGVVISPTAMTDFSPLQKESGGEKVITQYEMHSAEAVGLIKFDILGIRNLSILNSAIEIVKQVQNKSVDIKNIPLTDKKTYQMLGRGETMGTFQLGGSGMTRYLTELKPTRVEDLMAMVALFRPGPMANIPEYIKRKNNKKQIKYLHPKMEKFLDKSYGILVYQEDILFTAIELAGYDWKSVDKLRKAVGKKIPAEMKKQEKIFISGCIEHSGMTQKQARGIWDLFVPFQGYGFNKAHAAAYGLVSYQTAYMKANYPVEFMTAVLTAESGNIDKITEAIEECKRMKIPVLPPDINQSKTDFTIVDDSKSKHKKAIRFGLSAIKNVGAAAIESITKARKHVKKFNSLTHFLSLMDSRKVNKKVLESLIKVGAMDAFGKRSALLAAIDIIRDNIAKKEKQVSSGQESLFEEDQKELVLDSDPLPDIDEMEKSELLGFEKQLLGFYLTEHPMAKVLKTISGKVSHKLSDLDPNLHSGQEVTLGGIIQEFRTIYTKKNNQQMAFLSLEGETGSVDVVVFPRVWDQYKTEIKKDTAVLITGTLETRDEGINLIAQKIKLVTDQDSKPNTDFVLNLPRGTDKNKLTKIGKLLKAHPGDKSLSIVISNDHTSSKTLILPYKIDYNPTLKKQINQIITA